MYELIFVIISFYIKHLQGNVKKSTIEEMYPDVETHLDFQSKHLFNINLANPFLGI